MSVLKTAFIAAACAAIGLSASNIIASENEGEQIPRWEFRVFKRVLEDEDGPFIEAKDGPIIVSADDFGNVLARNREGEQLGGVSAFQILDAIRAIRQYRNVTLKEERPSFEIKAEDGPVTLGIDEDINVIAKNREGKIVGRLPTVAVIMAILQNEDAVLCNGRISIANVKDARVVQLEMTDARLERQTRDAAERYRACEKPADRERIKACIRKLVEEHFRIRSERRMLEVKKLQEEIERLKEAIDRREKARDRLIDKRMRDLLGEEELDDVKF